MAKKSSIESNERRRRTVELHAKKREALKKVVMDRSADPEERFNATLKLAELPRAGSKTRIRNRCSLTGRPRGYYRKFGVSRIALRELASHGQLPGCVKSSW